MPVLPGLQVVYTGRSSLVMRLSKEGAKQPVVTECVPADPKGILKAAGILRQGGVAAFPTETVYGLGANALDAGALAKVFEAKGRPGDNPLIAHVPGIPEARELGEWNPLAQLLAEAFWPGPLTLVVARRAPVPDLLCACLPTLALRAPSHPAARALISACGFPVAAPSANRSGRPSPVTAAHVMEDLAGRIPLVLDGGPCEVGLESTVADVSGAVPLILRPGAVTPEMVAMVAGECLVADSVMRPLMDGELAPSPGMRHKHYAPKARMTLVQGSPEAFRKAMLELAFGRESTWVLALDGTMDGEPGLVLKSMGRDAQGAAHRLFHLLRQADEEGVERIYAQALPTYGLGLAVMNRLARASGFDTLDAETLADGSHTTDKERE